LELVTPTPEATQEPIPTPLPTVTPDLSATPTATSTPLPTATPYTLEGYQAQFDEVLQGILETGLSEKQYDLLFETNLFRSKLLEEVTANTPKEEEQIWARHILVSDEEKAKSVVDRLNNGEDFSALAIELSDDTGSGASGGDLGWFGKGRMVPEFETAAYALEVGQISEPVESNFGWHIIQLLGRTTVSLTASQYEQARQTAFSEFLNGLRDEAEIVTYDDLWLERVPTSPNLQDLQQQ
jgi:parvulin-like peptidyl-prolyl isomerase